MQNDALAAVDIVKEMFEVGVPTARAGSQRARGCRARASSPSPLSCRRRRW